MKSDILTFINICRNIPLFVKIGKNSRHITCFSESV